MLHLICIYSSQVNNSTYRLIFIVTYVIPDENFIPISLYLSNSLKSVNIIEIVKTISFNVKHYLPFHYGKKPQT